MVMTDDKWIAIKFEEIDKRIDVAFSLRDKALEMSRHELHDRLAKMNEIREQLDSQARTFVRQDWVSTQIESLLGRINRNELSINTLSEKADQNERRYDRKLIIVGLIITSLQALLFFVLRAGLLP
jgi:hypothetical protein